MQTLQLDETNQLVVTQGSLSVISGVNACAQDLRTRVSLYAGENPFDTAAGIDFDTQLLGKMGGLDYIRDQVRGRILESEEVTGIVRMDVSREKDVMTVSSDINTIYGEVNI